MKIVGAKQPDKLIAKILLPNENEDCHDENDRQRG